MLAKGIATIFDKDLLIYLASIVNDRIEAACPWPRRLGSPLMTF